MSILSPSISVHPGDSPTSPKDSIKVLHVINGEYYSGAERVQDLLANCLPDFGFEVSFACVKPGLFPTERKNRSAAIFDASMRNRFDFRVSNQLANWVRQEDFQIIHAHTPRSAMVAAITAKKTGIPFVYHVHSPTARDSNRRLINWFNQKIENWALRKATRIVTVSDSLNSYMQELGFSARKITTIPNGVPIVAHPQNSNSTDEFIVGTMALFRPRKGTETLIEAIAQLKKKNSAVRLLAVGPFETAEYEKSLKNLADRLDVSGLIEWTGFTPNVDQEFSRMDLFALPSLYGEGLPMVLLEAMARKVPVLATDVEGIPQAVRSGVDGVIVPAGNASEFATQIENLHRDPKLRLCLAKHAISRQRECYSDVSMAKSLANLYRQLI